MILTPDQRLRVFASSTFQEPASELALANGKELEFDEAVRLALDELMPVTVCSFGER